MFRQKGFQQGDGIKTVHSCRQFFAGEGLVGKLASRKATNLEQEDAGGDDGIDGATGKTLKAANAASEVAATR
jgi:hypothetical protein